MKTFIIVLALVIAAAIGWYIFNYYQSSNSKPVVVNTKSTDTMFIVRDSIINAGTYDSIPSGFYQGMLPCKNCDGIQRTILFTNDDHYKMEELNWGKGTPARAVKGTWEKEKEKGHFRLYENDKPIAEYRLSKDSLINTRSYGIQIPDSLSHQYALFRKNTAPENVSWVRRRSEGVEILGTGGDPYWSVEIDKDKYVLFKAPSLQRPVIVPIEKPLPAKDSLVYSISTDGGNLLKVSIAPGFCTDGLSDHIYEYHMTVTYKGQTYKGCAVLLDKGMIVENNRK
ncbi:copper resistance protein NlpE N-terminal domain-containing protein [Flavitalea sp. BT771]|uniref:copper resistance protein NlpE N-terminal domain-containing protein n=1 Tax=Flavitalea sp. BT771 TaxID=3063329 RepID=UPI0026E170FF|nr:copper resistance protein NlpE N-terminal domain-containing protein [Flavitalea sp. BT771]MDO6434780.1 copper resistance protein NlpE N-terminal domain-containing protein [Flavitalea sp. BT771]MDV6223680.1 copper resistance protein NlpE N-terminal domain-containing protein [Flavitalea sp. BT771]